MTRARLIAASFALLMLPLVGCRTTPVVAAAPPPPPTPTVSVPPPTHPTEPEPEPEVVETPAAPTPTPPPPRRPRRRPTQQPVTPSAATPTPPTTVAANTPPTVDLGQLTTGGESNNTALRSQTEDLLKSQQRRLITLPSATVSTHSEQIEQARLFLRQADEAWKKQDIEGARTLATKAKVLLDEITE